MSKYTKTETARTIICDFCNQLYSDEPCEPAGCDWMRMLKGDAADVAPVVHGRWEEADWIETDDSNTEVIRTPKAALRCSHCTYAFKKELLWRNKYCPNCGARMDGEA